MSVDWQGFGAALVATFMPSMFFGVIFCLPAESIGNRILVGLGRRPRLLPGEFGRCPTASLIVCFLFGGTLLWPMFFYEDIRADLFKAWENFVYGPRDSGVIFLVIASFWIGSLGGWVFFQACCWYENRKPSDEEISFQDNPAADD